MQFTKRLVFMLFQCFVMLQGRENEFSLRKCSGGIAHLRTLEGTLLGIVIARNLHRKNKHQRNVNCSVSPQQTKGPLPVLKTNR